MDLTALLLRQAGLSKAKPSKEIPAEIAGLPLAALIKVTLLVGATAKNLNSVGGHWPCACPCEQDASVALLLTIGYIRSCYASSPLAPAATSVLAVLFAGGMVWAGMWLVGFLSLFPGFAMARAVAHRQSDDLMRLLRQHLADVHKWVVDELTFSANVDAATVVDADERPRPSTEVIVRS